MANLPGRGEEPWDQKMAAFLGISHNPSGTLKQSAFDVAASANAAITRADTAVFDVRKYGAVGDGVTDDRAAFQLALDAIHANGGGTLYVPKGYTFKLGFRSGFYGSSFKVCCFVFGSDVTITGGGKLLVTAGHANGFALFANTPNVITPATVDSSGSWWLDHAYLFPALGGAGGSNLYPTYALAVDVDGFAGYKGDTSITLATPAEHSNFAVGNAIHIRTGQTIATSGEGQPDSELNEITAIDTVTGELTLKYPLAKPYVQEYFSSGSRNTVTTTTPSANLALFGVQNIEDTVSRNITITDLDFEVDQVDGGGTVVAPGSVLGLDITQNRGTLKNAALQSGGPWRRARFTGNRVDVNATLFANVFFDADRACGDLILAGNNLAATGPEVVTIPCNEGTYNVALDRNRLTNPPSATNNHAIQVTARGYNVSVTGNQIDHQSSGSGQPLHIDGTVDGFVVDDNDFFGIAGGINSRKGVVGINRGKLTFTAGAASVPRTTGAWVYHDSPASTLMESIPEGAYLLAAEVQVWTAFNGTAPTLAVGMQGGYGQWFIATRSIATAGVSGDARNVADAAAHYQQAGAVDRTPEIVYTSGSSSAGRALVVLTWAYVPQGSGI